jgi:hypothetical protein
MHPDRDLAPTADVQVVGWPGLDYTLRVSGPPSAPVLTVARAERGDAADEGVGGGSVVMGLKG